MDCLLGSTAPPSNDLDRSLLCCPSPVAGRSRSASAGRDVPVVLSGMVTSSGASSWFGSSIPTFSNDSFATSGSFSPAAASPPANSGIPTTAAAATMSGRGTRRPAREITGSASEGLRAGPSWRPAICDDRTSVCSAKRW